MLGAMAVFAACAKKDTPSEPQDPGVLETDPVTIDQFIERFRVLHHELLDKHSPEPNAELLAALNEAYRINTSLGSHVGEQSWVKPGDHSAAASADPDYPALRKQLVDLTTTDRPLWGWDPLSPISTPPVILHLGAVWQIFGPGDPAWGGVARFLGDSILHGDSLHAAFSAYLASKLLPMEGMLPEHLLTLRTIDPNWSAVAVARATFEFLLILRDNPDAKFFLPLSTELQESFNRIAKLCDSSAARQVSDEIFWESVINLRAQIVAGMEADDITILFLPPFQTQSFQAFRVELSKRRP